MVSNTELVEPFLEQHELGVLDTGQVLPCDCGPARDPRGQACGCGLIPVGEAESSGQFSNLCLRQLRFDQGAPDAPLAGCHNSGPIIIQVVQVGAIHDRPDL